MENNDDLPAPEPESRRGFFAAGLGSSSSLSGASFGKAGRSIVIFLGAFLGLEDDVAPVLEPEVADGGGREKDDFFGGAVDFEATGAG